MSKYSMALMMPFVAMMTAPTFPPDPVRLITALIFGLAVGVTIHHRMQTYRIWINEQRPWRLARVALDGVIGGVIALASAVIVVRLRDPQSEQLADLPILLLFVALGIGMTGVHYLCAAYPDPLESS